MFLGHFGAALAAKRVAPATSLAMLFVAAQLVDLLWPVLVLAGVERVRVEPGNTAFTPLAFEHYPWSHSLLMVLAWAAALGVAYAARTRDRRGAAVVAALVVSHWLLDVLTHRPDLPLAPGAPAVGLGLWNSVPATIAVEGALFAAGAWLYARQTRPSGRRGTIALGSLVAVLVLVYVASVLGPPPPSAEAVASAGLLMWLFVAWAAWVDRARAPRAAPATAPTA
jgi:LexA-binding, inner membrane-associated putative hydrolase